MWPEVFREWEEKIFKTSGTFPRTLEKSQQFSSCMSYLKHHNMPIEHLTGKKYDFKGEFSLRKSPSVSRQITGGFERYLMTVY